MAENPPSPADADQAPSEHSERAHTYARRMFLSETMATVTAAAAAGGVASTAAAANKPQMAVFVITEIQSRALQTLLAPAFPTFDVVAYSRFRDFETQLTQSPAAVIAMGNTLKARNLKATVSGRTSAGSVIEPYVFVSLSADVDPSRVATVGTIDVLGRLGMNRAAADLIGGAPKVERVSKVQDLLPMLQLNAAQGVLLPERLVPVLQSRTEQKLHVARARGGLDLPCLVGDAATATAIRRLDAGLNRLLGVHQWQ